LSRLRNHIIEISATLLDSKGKIIDGTTFTSLIKPPFRVPADIVDLTGITDDLLKEERMFEEVGKDFLKFLFDKIEDHEVSVEKTFRYVIFVAHNGKVFDVPFLFKQLHKYNIDYSLMLWHIPRRQCIEYVESDMIRYLQNQTIY
jgi:DNA polymerase III alpha subunit (gram-positive type)